MWYMYIKKISEFGDFSGEKSHHHSHTVKGLILSTNYCESINCREFTTTGFIDMYTLKKVQCILFVIVNFSITE